MRTQMRSQGDGDCEPSAKKSNAEVRTKVRADVRTAVMGILNKCKKVKCRGVRKGTRTEVIGTLNQVQKGQMLKVRTNAG